MTGGRGASLDVPHGLAENPPCSACVSRSLAQVEPWDEILPMAESRGGTPRGERAALCARRTRKVRRLDTRLSAFRFLAFFPFLHFVARVLIVRCRCPPPAFSGEDRCGERGNSRRVT